jgi:hypothetical protein
MRTSLPLVDRAAPFKEELMPGLKWKDESPACRCVGLSAGGLAVGLTAAMVAAGAARAESANAIPQFASSNFGWQSNLEDWEDPPPGAGHGPIKNDPAYPFLNNTEGNRAGTGATKRITNTKDPVLKPWAAAQIQATNDEILQGVRDIPFTAQARCYPGGVPGQLLWPFEPVYFIQNPKEVWMIWQRDHMVRRIYMTDKHSETVKPSWFGESIGRYEPDGTLVVDTVGLSTHNSFLDWYRTPHSEKEHVVERFKVSADGRMLEALVTVEDPDAFNEPLHMVQRWRKVKNQLLETVCAENNGDHFSKNLFPIPQAATPDF